MWWHSLTTKVSHIPIHGMLLCFYASMLLCMYAFMRICVIANMWNAHARGRGGKEIFMPQYRSYAPKNFSTIFSNPPLHIFICRIPAHTLTKGYALHTLPSRISLFSSSGVFMSQSFDARLHDVVIASGASATRAIFGTYEYSDATAITI